MIDLSTITNNIAVMYALLLIIFLLMYLAFFRKSSPRKPSRYNTKH